MSFPWCCLLAPQLAGKSKAAVFIDAQWQKGEVISISFLDGSEALQNRVEAVAQKWIDRTGADLTFNFRKDPNHATDIRISFRQKGSWSLLGRYARLRTDRSVPTMNFGWLRDNSTDLEVQEVVLHEFGHALGLIHEHQSPEADIPWDKPKIFAELSGPPNNWDDETIEHNMFAAYDRSEVKTTPFDEDSIMLYPIDNNWTIGDYSTVNNTDLSPKDIELIRDIYA